MLQLPLDLRLQGSYLIVGNGCRLFRGLNQRVANVDGSEQHLAADCEEQLLIPQELRVNGRTPRLGLREAPGDVVGRRQPYREDQHEAAEEGGSDRPKRRQHLLIVVPPDRRSTASRLAERRIQSAPDARISWRSKQADPDLS